MQAVGREMDATALLQSFDGRSLSSVGTDEQCGLGAKDAGDGTSLVFGVLQRIEAERIPGNKIDADRRQFNSTVLGERFAVEKTEVGQVGHTPVAGEGLVCSSS